MAGPRETTTFTARFLPDPSVLRQARDFGRQACQELDVSPGDTELVVLVVNELAANAVLHARTPFEVALTGGPGAVQVSVSDENPRLPHLPSKVEMASSGRGLALVRAASQAWAVRTTAFGKELTAEVPTRRRNPHPCGTGPPSSTNRTRRAS